MVEAASGAEEAQCATHLRFRPARPLWSSASGGLPRRPRSRRRLADHRSAAGHASLSSRSRDRRCGGRARRDRRQRPLLRSVDPGPTCASGAKAPALTDPPARRRLAGRRLLRPRGRGALAAGEPRPLQPGDRRRAGPVRAHRQEKPHLARISASKIGARRPRRDGRARHALRPRAGPYDPLGHAGPTASMGGSPYRRPPAARGLLPAACRRAGPRSRAPASVSLLVVTTAAAAGRSRRTRSPSARPPARRRAARRWRPHSLRQAAAALAAEPAGPVCQSTPVARVRATATGQRATSMQLRREGSAPAWSDRSRSPDLRAAGRRARGHGSGSSTRPRRTFRCSGASPDLRSPPRCSTPPDWPGARWVPGSVGRLPCCMPADVLGYCFGRESARRPAGRPGRCPGLWLRLHAALRRSAVLDTRCTTPSRPRLRRRGQASAWRWRSSRRCTARRWRRRRSGDPWHARRVRAQGAQARASSPSVRVWELAGYAIACMAAATHAGQTSLPGALPWRRGGARRDHARGLRCAPAFAGRARRAPGSERQAALEAVAAAGRDGPAAHRRCRRRTGPPPPCA